MTEHTGPHLQAVPAESSADVRWRRWQARGAAQDRRHRSRDKWCAVSGFVVLGVLMLIEVMGWWPAA